MNVDRFVELSSFPVHSIVSLADRGKISRSRIECGDGVRAYGLYVDYPKSVKVKIRIYFMTTEATAVYEWETNCGYRWIRKPSDTAMVALLLKL